MLMLFAIALASYATARYYSPSLIFFVVEQTLLQRAPGGTDPRVLRSRLETHLAAYPSQELRLAEMLNLSMRLEKVQALSAEEIDGLLK